MKTQNEPDRFLPPTDPTEAELWRIAMGESTLWVKPMDFDRVIATLLDRIKVLERDVKILREPLE